MKVLRKGAPLGVFALATALSAALGGLMTGNAIDTWYRDLKKPGYTPPNWIFGPVWTVLYAAMAVAGWLVWRRRDDTPDEANRATALFGIQLALNSLWTGIFFGLRLPLAALVEIGALWSVIVVWLRSATGVDPRTRWLILPYLAWVSFAAALNFGIWWRNR